MIDRFCLEIGYPMEISMGFSPEFAQAREVFSHLVQNISEPGNAKPGTTPDESPEVVPLHHPELVDFIGTVHKLQGCSYPQPRAQWSTRTWGIPSR